MINTPAFESLMRYKKLKEALVFIKSGNAPHCYNWLLGSIRAALDREEVLASKAEKAWENDYDEA